MPQRGALSEGLFGKKEKKNNKQVDLGEADLV